MPRSLFYLSLFIIAVSSLGACKPPDRAETSAYYVGVDSFAVTDTDGITRINDYTINHFWCYANGAAGGVADLKRQLPLPLLGGKVNLFLYPGVTADGISQARVQYPFLTAFQKEETPDESGRFVYRPTVQWVKELKRPFPFDEDFEGELTVDSGRNGQRRVTTGTDGVHPAGGSHYGVMEAPGDGISRNLEMVQKEKIRLPQLGQPIYLEFIYRNNVPFTVGFYPTVNGISQVSNSDVILRENPGGWKKVYIYLTDEANTGVDGSQFQVFVRTITSGTTAEYVYLDNMRLMHLKE